MMPSPTSGTRCRFVVDGVRCPQEPIYRVILADCLACQRGGALFCLGHQACIEHGAKARGEQYRTAFAEGDDRTVAVEQISATYRRNS